MVGDDVWKRCSTCKTPIAFGSTYYQCSVSTCNRKRSGFYFCSVDCWEAHVPVLRHRDAGAVEETAPSKAAWEASQREDEGRAAPEPERRRPDAPEARRRIMVGRGEPEAPPAPREVLVIASRLKQYIRTRYDMNTSDAVLDILSDELRRSCDRAVRNARADGRKTVLERDFGEDS